MLAAASRMSFTTGYGQTAGLNCDLRLTTVAARRSPPAARGWKSPRHPPATASPAALTSMATESSTVLISVWSSRTGDRRRHAHPKLRTHASRSINRCLSELTPPHFTNSRTTAQPGQAPASPGCVSFTTLPNFRTVYGSTEIHMAQPVRCTRVERAVTRFSLKRRLGSASTERIAEGSNPVARFGWSASATRVNDSDPCKLVRNCYPEAKEQEFLARTDFSD
jgi:hypothetical protein